MDTPPIVNDLASVIQTSLAPVFLLAGTAGFVSIYTTRLGRVSDRLNEVAERGSRANCYACSSRICGEGHLLWKLRSCLG